MQNHIFRPIPDLDSLPEPGNMNKEERLKVIIANLEKRHRDVRASILQEARQKLELIRSNTATGPTDTMDMEIDGTPIPDHTQLIAHLNAPYIEGSGDPCVPPGGSLPPPPPEGMGVRQAPVPPEMALAREVTQQLEAYDRQAKMGREYYVKALERQRGLRGVVAKWGIQERV